jgi:nucleoside phosphorylase/tetratricopeptide (TPR) repeat protein
MKILLESQSPVNVTGRGAGRQYLYGEIPAFGGDRHRVVLALLPDTGNNQASARTVQLLEHFPTIERVILSGIAGGVPNLEKPIEHVRLGDIVVSNRDGVIQFDFVKEELSKTGLKIVPRHPPRAPSARLLEAVRILQAGELEGQRPWIRYIELGLSRLGVTRPSIETDVVASTANTEKLLPHPKDTKRINGVPRVFLAAIASSGTLQKNPARRDALRDNFAVKAIEMEGSGVADASWAMEVPYLVVRGICDYCDNNKGDEWQPYAAIVAAGFTRALLEATPPANSITPPDRDHIVEVDCDVNNGIIINGDLNHVTIHSTPGGGRLSAPMTGVTFDILNFQFESIASDLSDEKRAKLEELRELFREGFVSEAYEGVQALRHSQNWAAFGPNLRAMILRVLASMTLGLKRIGSVEQAITYAREATETEPNQEDRALQLRILIHAEGFDAALKAMDEPKTLDEYNLQVAILLETGNHAEALRILAHPSDDIEHNSETHRLHALAFLADGNLESAREFIALVLAEHPKRQFGRFNAAIINYYGSLSPLAQTGFLDYVPRPVPLSLVNNDEASRELLLKALDEFRGIAEERETASDERKNVEAWIFACLANLVDHQSEATEFCKRCLEAEPGNVRLIPWILFRNYDVDLGPSVHVLEKALEAKVDESSSFPQVLSLLGIYLRKQRYSDALRALQVNRKRFTAANERDVWHYWRAQVLVADGQTDLALEELSQIDEESLRSTGNTLVQCEVAVRSGDWKPFFADLESTYETSKDPRVLITLCETKAGQGDWAYVADKVELYYEAAGTEAALKFAVR